MDSRPRPLEGDLLDWLVVGGGVHGVHIAVRLLDSGLASPSNLRVVDPSGNLLESWRSRVGVTGMAYLRSPSMHHLDTESFSLENFARESAEEEDRGQLFTRPNNRPSTHLFRAHCDGVIQRVGLHRCHVRDRVVDVEPGAECVAVSLRSGERLRARRLVLALGAGDRLAYPSWAPQDDPRVGHVFEPDLPSLDGPPSRVCVVGGGISAAQVALAVARRDHQVELICRHPVRAHQYDSDPGWFGPKYMTGYHGIECFAERRALITRARNSGSMPPDVERALREGIESGQVSMHLGEVQGFRRRAGSVELLTDDGGRRAVDRVLLATGFDSTRPGGEMIDRLIARASLEVAPCGFPIVDGALRWHPRIHVSGALAELEVGPIARNIAGARRAGDRIVRACQELAAGAASSAPAARAPR